MDIPAYGEKNLAKIQEENDKNCCGVLPSQREREREREESLKTF